MSLFEVSSKQRIINDIKITKLFIFKVLLKIVYSVLKTRTFPKLFLKLGPHVFKAALRKLKDVRKTGKKFL